MMTYLRNLAGIPPLNIPEIGVSDILDIAIVAVFIYYIIRWIRRSRAWSLLKGIVMFALLAAFAYLFNLVTVSWVVQNAFAMGLIAIVILFQPELRRALEQLGTGVIIRYVDTKTKPRISSHTVGEIVEAVKQMAGARTGALICVEREVPLGDHEHSGIPIDALVSAQLLVNIFVNKTPLHDGAVIIRNNRVTAAACILPLTENDIRHELGTRHRAAVGASEVSDALVIVVSEETGTVALADGGRLKRPMTEKQLRDLLMKNSAQERRRLVLWKSKS
jgi:diadenylate cyclase